MTLARKLGGALFGLLILLGAYLGVYSIFASRVEYPVTGAPARHAWVRGAYHVHTTASHDGKGTLEEVARAARATGLQFVILTEHNAQTLPPPAFRDGVLLIQGVERSTPTGHAVSFGDQQILAHPTHPQRPWSDWEAGESASGLEVYSHDTMFGQALKSPTRLACVVGSHLGNPVHGLMVLARPDPQAVEKLLQISRSFPKVALCGLDAHGHPPYRTHFSTLALYLPTVPSLPEDPVEAAAVVLSAVRAGAALCVFDALGDPEGFEIQGLAAQTREAKVGQELRVKLPPTGKAQARVKVSGAARLEPDGSVRLVEAGPVFLEVDLLSPGCAWGEEWRPWIVPSPLYAR